MLNLDGAAQRLGDAGYEVGVTPSGVLVATRIVYDDYLSVTIAYHHMSQIVSHGILGGPSIEWVRFETGVKRRGEFVPFTFTEAVRRGVAMSRLLDMARRAAQAKPVIGEDSAEPDSAVTA